LGTKYRFTSIYLITTKSGKPPRPPRKPHSTVEVFRFFRGHAEALIYKGLRVKIMHFRNKKFSSQQDFGKKWRTFSKTGLRGQEPRGSRASLLTGLYYRLRYCKRDCEIIAAPLTTKAIRWLRRDSESPFCDFLHYKSRCLWSIHGQRLQFLFRRKPFLHRMETWSKPQEANSVRFTPARSYTDLSQLILHVEAAHTKSVG
jgi:hypothetical protein